MKPPDPQPPIPHPPPATEIWIVDTPRQTYRPDIRPGTPPPAPHLGDGGELGSLLPAVAQQSEGAKGVRGERAPGSLLLVDLVGEPRGFRLARLVRRLVERCTRRVERCAYVELKGVRKSSSSRV